MDSLDLIEKGKYTTDDRMTSKNITIIYGNTYIP